MESYTKLHKDCLRTIEQDAPIWNFQTAHQFKTKIKKTARKYGSDEQQGILNQTQKLK